MFRGFDLKLDPAFAEDHRDWGLHLFKKNKRKVKNSIDSFLDDDGDLVASRMRANWFPKIKADVFISHSHRDEDLAIRLAAWIELNFDIRCFIDSCVWGYAGDLLWLIDEKYCRNSNGKTFSYEKRNMSTSHVHMLLTTALSKMIDCSECILFLNTPNSINPNNVIKSQTYSPWIYSEIAMTGLVRRRTRSEHRQMTKAATILEQLNREMLVKYDVNLEHLTKLNDSSLYMWEVEQSECGLKHPLDMLYQLNKE